MGPAKLIIFSKQETVEFVECPRYVDGGGLWEVEDTL